MSQGVFNELFWVAGMVLTGDESQLLIIAEDAVEVRPFTLRSSPAFKKLSNSSSFTETSLEYI